MGALESQFFAYCQMRRLQTVRSGEISAVLKLTPKQERDLFYRLTNDGWIVRLRRGLFLVPARLPVGGKWMPDAGLVFAKLMEDCGGRYQLCGANAFNRWGFDDQVPTRYYAYNNRISGERIIAGLSFNLFKVADERLGATVETKTASGTTLIYPTVARTLMDAVYDWSRFNGIPRAYRWIREAIQREPTLAGELAKLSLLYGNQGTIRRMGYVLSSSGCRGQAVRRLRKAIRLSAPIPLIPTRPRRGRVDPDWKVIVNAD